jgi:glutaredoxin-like YruB-family protein
VATFPDHRPGFGKTKKYINLALKMKNTAIHSYTDLEHALQGVEKAFMLIYKKGSGQSDCALENIMRTEAGDHIPLFTVDVARVQDVHPRFGISSAPSLVLLDHGRVTSIIKGCQSPSYYEAVFTGKGMGVPGSPQTKKARQVVVYTAPSCSWCNTLKTYLKEHSVFFREVNVAADTAQAEAMVRKSGQQGVPQTEIDGQIVVGFDKNRINQLLDIQ